MEKLIKKNVVCIYKTKHHSSLKTVKPLIKLEDSILEESHSGTNTTCSHLSMKILKSELTEEESGNNNPWLGKGRGKGKKSGYRYPKQGNESYGIRDGYSWLTITG